LIPLFCISGAFVERFPGYIVLVYVRLKATEFEFNSMPVAIGSYVVRDIE